MKPCSSGLLSEQLACISPLQSRRSAGLVSSPLVPQPSSGCQCSRHRAQRRKGGAVPFGSCPFPRGSQLIGAPCTLRVVLEGQWVRVWRFRQGQVVPAVRIVPMPYGAYCAGLPPSAHTPPDAVDLPICCSPYIPAPFMKRANGVGRCGEGGVTL